MTLTFVFIADLVNRYQVLYIFRKRKGYKLEKSTTNLIKKQIQKFYAVEHEYLYQLKFLRAYKNKKGHSNDHKIIILF
jgi:hypothetical protein